MVATRIKICGITRPEDARAAVEGGVDAIGIVFYPDSPRALAAQEAREIIAVVPPFVTVVGLFVDEPAAGVRRILREVPVDLLQFHGEETPEYCRQFDRPWMKALRVRHGGDIVRDSARYAAGRGVLLDTWHEGKAGGTGQRFDWGLARGQALPPVVLAGGLDAENVAEGIHALHPVQKKMRK